MAKEQIVLKGHYGHFFEGEAASGVTFKPGMAAQLDSDGKYGLGTSGVDGERSIVQIVREAAELGKTVDDAYAAADPNVFMYTPLPGDEVLVLLTSGENGAAIGSKLICDVSTGKWIKTTGTVESEPFILLEAPGTITEDTLVLARFTGY